jgi:uncharacterized protein YbaP (TraB family)
MKLANLLALTAAPFALFAANPVLADHHAAKETAAPTAKGPALWKVADEDTTIYLFGTVHVLPKMAQSKGLLPAGTTLRSLLNAEQTTAFTAGMAKLGAPAEAFDPLKPWLAGLTFSLLPLMQSGYDPNSGVEKVLLAKAGDKQKDALETAEFQLGIFDGMPQDAQVTFMMEALTQMDKTKPMLDRMVAEWVKGDPDQLAAVMNEGMDDPKVAEALLYNRNANWAEWIDTRLDKPGTVFIAVGAGHLAGAKSVQDFLDKKGIKVTRVK